MTSRLLLSLSVLWLTLPKAFAQNADDFFHGGAVNYLSNNIPKALEVVTNGRALYPDDIKLKRLEELLKQQNQQQQQQQQQKDEKQKQDDKKDQQSKQDQKDQQKQQQDQSKKDQQKKDQQQQQQQGQPKSDDKQPNEPQAAQVAHAMTPQEAKQLLDAQKGEEQFLQFKQAEQRETKTRRLKDW